MVCVLIYYVSAYKFEKKFNFSYLEKLVEKQRQFWIIDVR